MNEHHENNGKPLLGEMVFLQYKLAKENRIPPSIEPIAKDLYLDDFKNIEGKMLPLAHFKALLKEFRRLRHELKRIYLPDTKFMLAAIPVNDSGYDLSEQQMTEGEYLRPLMVGKNGLTYYFSLKPAKYADVLPAEMQADCTKGGCSFDMKYSDVVPNFVNDGDYKVFVANYLRVFNNLRKFFGKPELTPEDFADVPVEELQRDYGELIEIGFLERKAA